MRITLQYIGNIGYEMEVKLYAKACVITIIANIATAAATACRPR